MKRILTLLIALCLIVSVCSMPVAAAAVEGQLNIKIADPTKALLSVSGKIVAEEGSIVTENEHVTITVLPDENTMAEVLAGTANPVAMVTTGVASGVVSNESNAGTFAETLRFNATLPSGTYDFYVMYNSVTSGPFEYEFFNLDYVATVIRNIGNGTTATENIVTSLDTVKTSSGVDVSAEFPEGTERNLFVFRTNLERGRLTDADNAKLLSSFNDLVDKIKKEIEFVNNVNAVTYYGDFVALFEEIDKVENTTVNFDFAAYNALSDSQKAAVGDSFLKKIVTNNEKFANGDEIKAFFNASVASASNNVTTDGTVSSGTASGGGGGVVPVPSTDGDSREWPSVMDDNSANTTTATFTDIASVAWAHEAINTLAAKGVIAGTSYGIFEPNGNVTREQFAKMLVLATGKYNSSAVNEFTDIPAGDWSAPYVASAKAAGFVNGIGEGKFGYGRSITREDMAVMIYNVMKANGVTFDDVNAGFDDYAEISDYAKEAVGSLTAKGIINGIGDNKFAPKATATRAQAALLVYAITKGVA